MVELSSSTIPLESNVPSTNLIRIKHLFLIFVRQFDAEEYKLFCQYMKNLLNQPLNDPFELLGKYPKFQIFISIFISFL